MYDTDKQNGGGYRPLPAVYLQSKSEEAVFLHKNPAKLNCHFSLAGFLQIVNYGPSILQSVLFYIGCTYILLFLYGIGLFCTLLVYFTRKI